MEPPIGHSEILLRVIPQRNAGRWPNQSIGLAFSVGFYRDDGAFQKKSRWPATRRYTWLNLPRKAWRILRNFARSIQVHSFWYRTLTHNQISSTSSGRKKHCKLSNLESLRPWNEETSGTFTNILKHIFKNSKTTGYLTKPWKITMFNR